MANVVAELFETDKDIATLFHPDVKWIDATGQDIKEGDGYNDDFNE